MSVLQDGVANVPIAGNSVLGVSYPSNDYGTNVNANGRLQTYPATSGNIKSPAGYAGQYRPISPSLQHESTFYGLAKAAGDTTQSQSNNEVGNYTEEAKSAIRTMLGAGKVDDV